MRGKISDLDLTNYALNELEPRERLYVESMLAVSEECRADVYEMIEMGQMLEEGFEAESEMAGEGLALRPDQRGALLAPRRRPLVGMRNAAALLASAACLGLFLTHPGLWPNSRSSAQAGRVAGSAYQGIGADASAGAEWRTFMEEPVKWVDDAASVCTPPQWLDIEAQPMSAMGLTDLGGMAY